MGVAFQQNGYTIIQTGREYGIDRQGVALILSSEYANGLLSYEAVFPMMVSVCVKTRTGLRNISQVYAPSSSFFQNGEELQVQGDYNETVGEDQHFSWPEVVGTFGLGRANDRRK